MRKIRKIKIYNNRRLYDFLTCSYTRHKEVRQLVRDGEPLQIVNVRGKDVTLPVMTKMLSTSPDAQRNDPRLLRDVTRLVRRTHG